MLLPRQSSDNVRLIDQIVPRRLPLLQHYQLNRLAISVISISIILVILDYTFISFSISDFSGDLSYKHARIAARKSSILLLLISYFYNYASTFISVGLFYSRRPFDSLSISLIISALVLSIYFSQASNITIFLIVYLLRFSRVFFENFTKTLKISSYIFSFFVFIPLLKIFANILWLGSENTRFAQSNNYFHFFQLFFSNLSFSKIESLSAFEITSYFVADGFILPTNHLWPYLHSLSAFNPFTDYQSYAKLYADYIRDGAPGNFSFSPLAEACVELGSCHFAALISSLILVSIILLSLASKNIWLRLIIIQFILRYHRLDLYSSMRRYFYVEAVFIFLVLISIAFITRLKLRHPDSV